MTLLANQFCYLAEAPDGTWLHELDPASRRALWTHDPEQAIRSTREGTNRIAAMLAGLPIGARKILAP